MPKSGWKSRTELFKAMPYDELVELVRANSSGPDWLQQTILSRNPYKEDLQRWLDHGKMSPGLKWFIQKLPREQQGDLRRWKRDRISPKLQRWIYWNLTSDRWQDDPWTNRNLLSSIARSHRPAPWRLGFLWNEVYRLKSYPYGRWVLEAMSSRLATFDDSPRYIDLYHDQSADPTVRGEAIFGLAYSTPHREQDSPPESQTWNSVTQETCLEALTDEDNACARAGGCLLAERIGGFGEELEALALDDTWIGGANLGEAPIPVSTYAQNALGRFDSSSAPRRGHAETGTAGSAEGLNRMRKSTREAFGQEGGVLAELRSRLAKFSDRLTVEQTDQSLFIKPKGPDTFPIEVRDDGEEITIFACRWHAHLEDPEQAVYCAMWLLTPIYRIVEVEQDGSWIKSWLERFMLPGEWRVDNEICAFDAPSRINLPVVRIAHQQSVLPVPEELIKQYDSGTINENGFPIGSHLKSPEIGTR